MKEQIIQVEPHDNIDSIRDKLGWVRAPRVLVITSQRNGPLSERLDLLLLQRECTRRRIQLAVITKDPLVIEHARDLGIATFRTIKASHRKYWRSQRAKMSVSREEQMTPLNPELIEAATRLNPEPVTLPPQVRRLLSFSITTFIILMLLVGGGIIAPGATITVTPASNQVSVTTTVTASPESNELDIVGGIIPARQIGVEVQGSTNIRATGTGLEPSVKARGIALFSNLIPDDVTIPAGTIVRTSAAEPVRFVTLNDVTLPGQIGETVEVPIEALDAGFGGNLPSNRINEIDGPLATRLAVTNPQPTSGGDSRDVPAVAEADLQRIRDRLLQQLQQRAFVEMQSSLLTDTEFLPIESLRIVLIQSEIYDGFVGEIREEISLSMQVTVQGLSIDERFARQIVYDRLVDKIGSGFIIGSESLVFRRGDVVEIGENREVVFIMQGAGDVTTRIEEETIIEMVQGVNVNEAILRLDRELPLGSPPEIETWPEFWPLMPALTMRIRVTVEGQ